MPDSWYPKEETSGKTHIVRLTKGQRKSAQFVVNKFVGSLQKVKRVQISLKAAQPEGGWTNEEISEALSYTINTVENVWRRFSELGFEVALDGKNVRNLHASQNLMVNLKPPLSSPRG